MSIAGTRADIAAALDTVTGVRGYAYRPPAPRAGDAWPLLGALERAEGLAFYVTWRVLVLLPQDERGASDWLDAHHEALVDALEPIAFVDRVEPVTIAAAGGDQFALQIIMRGE